MHQNLQTANIDIYPEINPFKESKISLRHKPSKNKKKSRILIVDDDHITRNLMNDLLSVMGYQVTLASNGFEGLECIRKDKYDLVITDLEMPGIDGWNLASKVKQSLPDMPVMMVTGQDKKSIEKKLTNSAVDVAMFKPFRIKEMTETVNSIL
jgi:CheY-like chemotaxis protein